MKWILLILMMFLAGCSQTIEQPVQEIEVPEIEPVTVPEIIDVESEAALINESEPEERDIDLASIEEKSPEPYVSGPLTDVMYEVAEQTYYYDGQRFGVNDPDYDGPAPNLYADERIQIGLFNILHKPYKGADFELNREYNYEHSGVLKEGESFVSREGYKIEVKEIQSTNVKFTLSKVAPSEHTIQCPDCVLSPHYRGESLEYDDGIYYFNVGSEGFLKQFSSGEIDKETNEVKLGLNADDEMIILEPNQVFIRNNGDALKYLFGSSYEWAGEDRYGYAAFGYVETHELPQELDCLTCTHRVYLKDGETQEIKVSNKRKKVSVEEKGKDVFFTYESDSAKLVEGVWVEINSEVSAKLLEIHAQYWIGLKIEDESELAVYCKGLSDEEMNFKRKGYIEYHLRGAYYTDYIEKEDMCLDDETLVEYSCKEIEGVKHDSGTGRGHAPILTYVKCECFRGKCLDNPLCIGDECN